MEEVKIEEVKVITKYKTSDDKVFKDKREAEIHEQYLLFREKVNGLNYVGGAYYCETQEDFDLLVDMKAYEFPFYNYNSGRTEPNYEYKKESFSGPDWYFFRSEYNNEGPDYYWVESLSEKKAEWDEFYSQFEIPKASLGR